MISGELNIEQCVDFNNILIPNIIFSEEETLPKINTQLYEEDYKHWWWCPVLPNSFYLIQCKDQTTDSNKIMGGVFYIPAESSYTYSKGSWQGVSMVNCGESKNARLIIFPTDSNGTDSDWNNVKGIKISWVSGSSNIDKLLYGGPSNEDGIGVYRLPIVWDIFSLIAENYNSIG